MMSQRIAALSRAARKCRGAVAYSVTATMLAFIACRDTGGVAGDVLHLRWSRPRLSSDPAGVAVAAADGADCYPTLEATRAEATRHPAAHPALFATSSETGDGIAELRTAIMEAALQ